VPEPAEAESPRTRRVAVVLVPGVGEEKPTETSTAVARGLAAHADGYVRGSADALEVVVPSGAGRPNELYHADRLSLSRPGARIDLIEMRWSDISRFPSGLLSFFTSLFGLGLQLMTVGLEASHRADDEQLKAPPGRWAWISALALVAGALVGLIVQQAGGGVAGGVLGGAVVGGLVLLGAVVRLRRDPAPVANALMEATSWLVAALVVPLTVIAAMGATALWLVVDDTLGIDDVLASVLVGLVGALALWRLARGIADGGWRYGGGGWRVALDPRLSTGLLLAAAVAVGAWNVIATDSVAAGLSRVTLLAGGFGLRGAWLVAVALVGATLIALIALMPRSAPALRRLWFTEVATTAVSALAVAVVGAILIGGIGAVAYSTATDATWGRDAPEVRCLAEPSSWTWSRDCGDLGRGWGPLADGIARDLAAVDEREALLAGLRARALVEADAAARERLLDGLAAEQAAIDRTRDQAALAEREARAAPVWWAQDLFAIVTRPLAWIVVVLIVVAILAGGMVGAMAARARLARRPRGSVLSAVLRDGPGLRGGALLLALGLAGAAWTWAVWTVPGEGWSGLPFVSAVGGALASAGLLALVALARVLPVDPRDWRGGVGAGLERMRGYVDRAYDVATYLRIDPTGGAGVRTRIIRRFRAVLDGVEDDYDEVVIVAHSQGTMLTVATLFGDALRREREAPGEPWGVRPWREVAGASPLTTRLRAVLTFGSPFRQTYEARLPGQYDWLDPSTGDALATRLRPFRLTWVNAYRARDFVGRAVFQDPLSAGSATEGRGRSWTVAARARPLRLVDVCLRGPGSHTGYWSDPELIAWLHGLLRAGEPLDPIGYDIAPASPA